MNDEIQKNELKLSFSLGGLLLLLLSFFCFKTQFTPTLATLISPGLILCLGVFVHLPLCYCAYSRNQRVLFNIFPLIFLCLIYLLGGPGVFNDSLDFNVFAAIFFSLVGFLRIYEAFLFRENKKIYPLVLSVISFLLAFAIFFNWPLSILWNPYPVIGIHFLLDGIVFIFVGSRDDWVEENSLAHA